VLIVTVVGAANTVYTYSRKSDSMSSDSHQRTVYKSVSFSQSPRRTSDSCVDMLSSSLSLSAISYFVDVN